MPEAGIPSPAAVTLPAQLFAAYGALIAAGMLALLYLHRGRAFVVYWIGSWILLAGSLLLPGRGYADPPLGGVMLGLAQLLGVWSAGLTLLAARAFPEAPLKWGGALTVAALTAVWFFAAPFMLAHTVVLASGRWAIALLCAWSAVEYVLLLRRTHHIGATIVAGGLAVIAVGTAAFEGSVWILVVYMFVALGVHVLVFEDLTQELRRANDEVKRLAITDPLTGCHNRRFFDEIERREMLRHQRYGTPISIVFVDVNRFKRLNDTLGHDMGDALLRSLGGLLRRQVRQSDYVIRWGGDEFVLLLTCTGAEAVQKGEELKAAFTRLMPPEAAAAGVGLSVGVAEVTKDADGLDETIRTADSRMDRDKPAIR